MHVLKHRGAGLEFVDPYSMLFDRPFITWYPNDEILFFLAKPPFLLYLVEINNPPILPLIFSLKSLKCLYGSLKNPSPYRPAGLLRWHPHFTQGETPPLRPPKKVSDAAAALNGATALLRVLTYNVWFSSWDRRDEDSRIGLEQGGWLFLLTDHEK